jgi:hypothetical protein
VSVNNIVVWLFVYGWHIRKNGGILLVTASRYINVAEAVGGRSSQSAPHYLGIIKAGKTTARRYAGPNDFYGVCNIAGT